MIPGLYVELEFKEGGAVIHGDHPSYDYEYWLTIAKADMPLLAAALGTSVKGIASAWTRQRDAIIQQGESTWLTEHHVPYTFFSWSGGDADW